MQSHVISYIIENKCTVVMFFYVSNQGIMVHAEDDISSYLLCSSTTNHIRFSWQLRNHRIIYEVLEQEVIPELTNSWNQGKFH